MVRCLVILAVATVIVGVVSCTPQVNSPDTRPAVWAGKDQCVGTGDAVTLTAIAEGLGSLTYRWSVQSTPNGSGAVEFESETAPTTTTSTLDVAGDYSFRVIVTDSRQFARSSYVTVTVGPPGAEGDFCVTTTGPANLNVGGSSTYSATVDRSGTYSYLWEGFRVGDDDPSDLEPTSDLRIDSRLESETVVTALAEGSFVLRVSVLDSDSQDEGVGSIDVTVSAQEDLTVSIDGPITTLPDETIELTAVAENGGDALTYEWQVLSGTADLEDDDQATVRVTPTQPGTVQMEVSVTDEESDQQASATHTVTVENPGDVEVTASAESPLLRVGDELGLTASVNGTFDEVVYGWAVGLGDPGVIEDPSSPDTTLTATAGDTIEVRVDVIATRDEETLTGSAEFVVVSYEAKAGDRPIAVIDVEDFGEIELALEVDASPKTVANFLQYVDEGFYDGVVFHRVASEPDDFVIQGGAFEPDGDSLVEKEETRDPVESEAPNGLSNVRGTVSMALRGQDADSGDVQFFINLSDDNDFLDEGPPPFSVFATVVGGLDVVDDIADVETGTRTLTTTSGEREFQEVPLDDVIMRSIFRRLADGDDGGLTGDGGS